MYSGLFAQDILSRRSLLKGKATDKDLKRVAKAN